MYSRVSASAEAMAIVTKNLKVMLNSVSIRSNSARIIKPTKR
jgi:hypothetical protein